MANGTVIQKIIDAHFVSGEKIPGYPISIKIDQTLTQDATGTMAYLELEAMGIDRVKTELSVSYVDHNMMQNGPENQNDHLYLQSVAAAKGVYFSRPGNGICHQVHLERFGVPGKTLLGSDSHTPTNGGIGMMAIGAGGLDVALAMAGKPFRMAYPKVIGVKLDGHLKPWISAKDIVLKMLSILSTKGNVGCMVEYFGPGVANLSVPERATITNMGAELGVTASVFPSDERTKAFLEAQGRGASWTELKADENAEYDRVIEIDLKKLVPMAACPSSPDNIRTVSEIGDIPVQQVIIGSCTNSSYQDLMLVAKMLKNRKIAKHVSFSIAPGSRQVLNMMADNGALADMIAAGARILETSCGACIGQGMSPANDAVTLRTFNRNFAGRTGTKGDMAYLVSPATAAAAALTGKFIDPRELGIKFPKVTESSSFLVDDDMIIPPVPKEEAVKVEIVRKPTIGKPPVNAELPENIKGEVVIKVGDKITTDHIMPAGIHLKHRSNIPEYSKVVFECFSEQDKPTFAQRAATVRDSGRHGVIIARESYGQGSSREHAAICPMFLGIKVLVSVSIERIHAANLVNFGIVPLIFADSADYDQIAQGDALNICELRSQLGVGKPVKAEIVKADGEKKNIELKHNLSAEDITIILAGGCLNC
ncbi:MAG TPA: aconitate hydratase [Lentisphaeria bacterium]|nr:MAG: aconitate hydratase [Lentisphaerae bacterium GWF2_50_93]HCE45036.1 aconitate hydratase [Lentisphaeria bacterium]